jgi:hypothetical protein
LKYSGYRKEQYLKSKNPFDAKKNITEKIPFFSRNNNKNETVKNIKEK